jgi:hypothetical protein
MKVSTSVFILSSDGCQRIRSGNRLLTDARCVTHSRRGSPTIIDPARVARGVPPTPFGLIRLACRRGYHAVLAVPPRGAHEGGSYKGGDVRLLYLLPGLDVSTAASAPLRLDLSGSTYGRGLRMLALRDCESTNVSTTCTS